MADFAIRVELQGNPTREQYDALHALMARKGFYQYVTGVDAQQNQKRFNLPHAMYYGSSANSCADGRTSVAAAIRAEIQQNIIVFVVQAATWALG
jgi:hypothetical protein